MRIIAQAHCIHPQGEGPDQIACGLGCKAHIVYGDTDAIVTIVDICPVRYTVRGTLAIEDIALVFGMLQHHAGSAKTGEVIEL